MSIQHYLVNMVNRILTILDRNNEKEKYAVIAKLVDWSKAFDMQDPTLGVQSFKKWSQTMSYTGPHQLFPGQKDGC